jgi:transcriptional regulator with XRE-family HTH domain
MAEEGKGERPMVSGLKIRHHREALKQRTRGRQGSQSWLAKQIGAHFTSVSDWERGVNQPSPRHLRAIADALGVRIEDLYGDDDEEDDPVAALTTAIRRLVRDEVRSLA